MNELDQLIEPFLPLLVRLPAVALCCGCVAVAVLLFLELRHMFRVAAETWSAATARVSKRTFGIAAAVAALIFAGMIFSLWRISTVAAPWAVTTGFGVALVYGLALAVLRLREAAPDDELPAPRPPRASGKPRLRRVK